MSIENQAFKKGDIVQLKSGGPLMTIQSPDDGGWVRCIWFSNVKADFSFYDFSPVSLKLIPEDTAVSNTIEQ